MLTQSLNSTPQNQLAGSNCATDTWIAPIELNFTWGSSHHSFFGGSMPAFCLLFGDMIDSVGSSDGSDGDSFSSLQTQAKYMIYIGLGVWMFSWF